MNLLVKMKFLPLYIPREKFAHKGTYGHSLIIGGSYGKMGSVCLASKAALYSGSGLVTAYVPKIGYSILQTALPEVMVLTDADENELTDLKFDIEPTVIGVGIGLGTSEATVKALSRFFKKNKFHW